MIFCDDKLYSLVKVVAFPKRYIIYFCCQSVRFVIASFHHDILSVEVTIFCAILTADPHADPHFGNWPKITNIQPILTIPSTPTPLLLPLIYLCELIMNISQKKGRCSIMTKIELYWNSKNVLLRIYCTSVFFYLIVKQIQVWYGLQHCQKLFKKFLIFAHPPSLSKSWCLY